MQAAVGRSSDFGVSVGIHIAKINRVVRADSNRGITAGTDALGVGHGAHDPAQSIVGGNSNAGSADTVSVHALFVGDVRSAVRRNANVAMQAAAGAGRDGEIDAVDGGEGVDGDARTEGEATVVTPRAECDDDVLRAVVDGVRIRGVRGG